MKAIEKKQAEKDKLLIRKSYSKADQSKLRYFVLDILDNPRSKDTVGKPEELKGTETELWSRRISKKDRIVYGIEPGSNYGMPEETMKSCFFINILGIMMINNYPLPCANAHGYLFAPFRDTHFTVLRKTELQ